MNRAYCAVLCLLFFATVAAFASFQIIDTDIWLYLRIGEQICANLEIPGTDIFSYTAGERPWVNTHWLAQVMLFFVYRVSGAVGLCVMRAALVLAIFAILWRCCRAYASPQITAAILTLALLASSDGFLIKPHLISLLIATVFLYLCERSPLLAPGFFWWFVPLQIFWVNAHPSFFLGPILILIYLLDAVARGRDAEPGTAKNLSIALLLSVISCAVNPYGFSIIIQPVRQLSSPLFNEKVILWTPPSLAFPSPLSSFIFALILIISVFSLIFNVRRARIAHVAITAIFALLALKSRRHIPLFAILSAPALCRNIAACADRMGKQRVAARALSILLSAALPLALLFLLHDAATSHYYHRQRSLKRFGLGKSAIAYPDAAIDFLESHGAADRIFCNYDIGSYVAARLFPHHKIFIDGRNLVYGEEIMQRYLGAMGDINEFRKLAREYSISTLLLTHSARDARTLIQSAWNSREWDPVYADDRAVVFIKGEADPAHPRLSLGDCKLNFTRVPDSFPLQELRSGEFLFTIGLRDCARRMFLSAIDIYGPLPEAHNYLGLIALQEGDREAAMDEFRRAAVENRMYAEPRINLAVLLLDTGNLREAMRLAGWAARIAPSNPHAHGSLGLVKLCAGQLPGAARALRKAISLDPGEAEYHSNLGTAYERQGEPEKARAEYETARRLSATSFAPRFNLALLLAKMGDRASAAAMYREALAINPRHEAARRNLSILQREMAGEQKAK